MRKIKGFKLVLRPKEIIRRAKKAGLDLQGWGYAELTPAYGARARELAATAEFQTILDRAQAAMQPAVLFDSFSNSQADAAAELTPMPGLAYSLILATLGRSFDEHKSQALAASPEKAPLWAILEESALEDAVRFAAALLEQEAAGEGMELSPLNVITGPQALARLMEKLPGAKIGLSLAGDLLDPPASRAVSLSWLAKARKKTSK